MAEIIECIPDTAEYILKRAVTAFLHFTDILDIGHKEETFEELRQFLLK